MYTLARVGRLYINVELISCWDSIIAVMSLSSAWGFSSDLLQVLLELVSVPSIPILPYYLPQHLVGGLLSSGFLALDDFGPIKRWRKVSQEISGNYLN